MKAVVAASLAVAVVAVTAVLLAVTATVPNIFLEGSEKADLLNLTAVALEIAPVTGSLFTVIAVLLVIAEITKVFPLFVWITSPTLHSTAKSDPVPVTDPSVA